MGNSRSQPFENDIEMAPDTRTTERVVSLARFGTGTSTQWELHSTGPGSQYHHHDIAPTSSSEPASQDRDLLPVILELHDKLELKNQIRRVPPHFKQKRCDVYHPIIVSLGPYHHGKPDHRLAEDFKKVSLKAFLSKTGHFDESYFHKKILDRIQEVRNCYEEVEYDNNSLARLMLCDACFFIFTMELTSRSLSKADVTSYVSYFGIGAMNLIERDILLLENQIPFWIIKLLTCSQSYQGQMVWNKLLLDHLNLATSMQLQKLPWENEEYEPCHYLDALRHYIMPIKNLEISSDRTMPPTNDDAGDIYKQANYHFPSVTNLNAMGIRLKPNKANNNVSIRFSSGQLTLPRLGQLTLPSSGQLTLPRIHMSINFFVLYSNFIAYEIFPTSNAKLYATSYVNFMKSLIETPNDAKVLRKEGILITHFGNDIEVVQIIKDLHTFGVERSEVFMELKASIAYHCSRWSRFNSWKAELMNVYFRSPWSIIAMLAASALLLMTFLQTLFTSRQRN